MSKAIITMEVDLGYDDIEDYEVVHVFLIRKELPHNYIKVDGQLCNLKPMPTHVIDRNTFAIENKYANYQDGYNECIDEILGGNDE